MMPPVTITDLQYTVRTVPLCCLRAIHAMTWRNFLMIRLLAPPDQVVDGIAAS